jgi:hypothetical protein
MIKQQTKTEIEIQEENDNLVALVQRLIRRLNQTAPHDPLPKLAMAYLKEHDLLKSLFRTEP